MTGKRLATEREAAESIPLPLATFRNWVATGRLPMPLPECGLFDLKAIDAAIDRMSGIGARENALDAWRENRNAR